MGGWTGNEVVWQTPAPSGYSISRQSGRTASFSGAGGRGRLTASGGKSSGKWYVEVLVNSHSNHAMVGMYKSSTEYSMIYNSDMVCCVGHIGSSYPTLSTSAHLTTDGSILGFALDMDAGTLNAYHTGALVGSMSALQPNNNFATGTWRVSMADGTGGANSMSVTILDAPTMPVPNGFSYWME